MDNKQNMSWQSGVDGVHNQTTFVNNSSTTNPINVNAANSSSYQNAPKFDDWEWSGWAEGEDTAAVQNVAVYGSQAEPAIPERSDNTQHKPFEDHTVFQYDNSWSHPPDLSEIATPTNTQIDVKDKEVEIVFKSERNQYLETGQLIDEIKDVPEHSNYEFVQHAKFTEAGEFNNGSPFNDSLPPPFSRIVVGQREQSDVLTGHVRDRFPIDGISSAADDNTNIPGADSSLETGINHANEQSDVFGTDLRENSESSTSISRNNQLDGENSQDVQFINTDMYSTSTSLNPLINDTIFNNSTNQLTSESSTIPLVDSEIRRLTWASSEESLDNKRVASSKYNPSSRSEHLLVSQRDDSKNPSQNEKSDLGTGVSELKRNKNPSRFSRNVSQGYENYDDYDYDDRRHIEHNRNRPSHRSYNRGPHYNQHKYGDNFNDYDMYMNNYGRLESYRAYYNMHQYQYYEHLRNTNPQAYAELYKKMYQQHVYQQYDRQSRQSLHSGRSSTTEDLIRGRAYDCSDQSNLVNNPRATPLKYSTVHARASFWSGNSLVYVQPFYQRDKQSAIVQILPISELMQNDHEYQEVLLFPGPLMKGISHKKTIIEYCEDRIKRIDVSIDEDASNCILLWELLILLLRQNGIVVGTDIAELLMKNVSATGREDSIIPGERPSSVNSVSSNNDVMQSYSSISAREDVTNKFRNCLIYGSTVEALDLAMKNGLWGHALFLASKLDKNTYANVMKRFANGLPFNDPLQTLYQLLSGSIPAAATCVADERWGDWRPHLAMILSNATGQGEINQQAICTLGDTLRNRGCRYASQFCYIVGQVQWGTDVDNDRLVLLGKSTLSPPNLYLQDIHMTEIYEYVCVLSNQDIQIPALFGCKYRLAVKLMDLGFVEKSWSYLNSIAVGSLADKNSMQNMVLLKEVCELEKRLRCVVRKENDIDWILKLELLLSDQHVVAEPNIAPDDPYISEPQYYSNVAAETNENTQNVQEIVDTNLVAEQPLSQQIELPSMSQHSNDMWNYTQEEDTSSLPKISLPNQSRMDSLDGNFDSSNMDSLQSQKSNRGNKNEDRKDHQAMGNSSSAGWLNGLFGRFSIKPKNQMKLPDDKNPTIIWDPVKKRWVNTEDDTDCTKTLAPPPKLNDMMQPQAVPKMNATENVPPYSGPGNILMSPSNPTDTADSNSKNNIFKMQRSRNLKKSYVDVFNRTGGGGASLPVMDTSPAWPKSSNLFTPIDSTNRQSADMLMPVGASSTNLNTF